MKRLFQSLSIRLFAALAGIVAAILFAYAILNFLTISKLWVDATEQHAVQTSELIRRSTRYGMLLNRKDDVHETIRDLAQESGIAGIRIYDKLGRIMFSNKSEEIQTQVDMKAEACVFCHSQSEPLRSLPSSNRMRMYRGPTGEKVLALITPIENEPACFNNACHAHPKNQTVLGVLDVRMSLAGLDRSVAATRANVIWVTLVGALLVALVTALLIHRMVRRPVRLLIKGARRVAAGDLSTHLPAGTKNELGELAQAFNHMMDELDHAQKEITRWSSKLEQKVIEKTDELSRSQRQVVQMEKMASLGKMATSVAHELNNPLAGVLTYAKLISRMLREEGRPSAEREELLKYLDHIQRESSRCGDIVRSLLLFAKPSDVKLGRHPIREIIDRSLMVVQHHMDMAQVLAKIELADPQLSMTCDASLIQQALVALLVNAVEAMAHGGALYLSAREEKGRILLDVSDTGVGISQADLPHIFEPFFTTKEGVVSGTGLGLAVVYGIVRKHNGTIEVDSTPGKGTTFHLSLPVDPGHMEGQKG
ncbi:MAG TPA: ATP-binding protein [Bdellovibrionota bacterium]|nr:ATP-binding protein [Bdellovibrionota bacterium]